MIRLERDRLKLELEQIAATRSNFEELRTKAHLLEIVMRERDQFKAKYEELLGLECECDILKAQVRT